jgi:predicted membrane protein
VVTTPDTGTYLLIVFIGTVVTVIVGQILMRTGVGFLRDVFDDHEVAQSITRLLGVGFHLVALGFMALISTWAPFAVDGTVQLVVTRVGGILLFLGILHVITLLALARVRNNARAKQVAASLRSSARRPPPDKRDQTRVIESGSG